MRQSRYINFFICLTVALLSVCSCIDSDDDDDDDIHTDDDTGDDDDIPQGAPVPAPLQWGRYVCGELSGDEISITAGSYNLHGGQEASAQQIGAGLAAHGPFDVFALQECPDGYAQPIAEALGMDFFFSGGQAIMSTTPLKNPEHIVLANSHRHILHSDIEIDGTPFSVYGVHIGWNQGGDDEASQIIDPILKNDPADRIVLMGDWNEEYGSTQVAILNQRLADGWSSLGVHPSARTSWPAAGFYGGEGQQLIDNVYFNKEAGACAVAGEIINFSPPLSDHKPQWITLAFDGQFEPDGPKLLDYQQGFGPEAVGLLLDKPLQSIKVKLAWEETVFEATEIDIIGDGTIALVQAGQSLPAGSTVTATVLEAVDIDSVANSDAQELSFTWLANILVDGDAESGGTNWRLDEMEASAGRHHVFPLDGRKVFTGRLGSRRGYAYQTIHLEDQAAAIDAGLVWLTFSGASITGYRKVEDGDSNLLLPHDETEAVVDLYDADGRFLDHLSSGRFDTMYWQPWRVVKRIPPRARRAEVTLRSVAVELPFVFNTGAFDSLHLAVAIGQENHEIIGGNLLANPLFRHDLDNWESSSGLTIMQDHWFPFLRGADANSFTGDYMVSALTIGPAAEWLSQSIDLADYREYINQGVFGLHWGAAMRDLAGLIEGRLGLVFQDAQGAEIQSHQLDPVRISEWFTYSTTTPVPIEAAKAIFTWEAIPSGPVNIAAFIDAPFVYPVVLK